MNEHVSGAEQQISSTGETPAPEFDALTWSAEHALKAMVEYQVESLRFIARRTYCNLEFMRHLRHCAGWQEIAQVQQSWFKECVADYGEELGRLAVPASSSPETQLAPRQAGDGSRRRAGPADGAGRPVQTWFASPTPLPYRGKAEEILGRRAGS